MRSEQKCVGASKVQEETEQQRVKRRACIANEDHTKVVVVHIHRSYPLQPTRKMGNGWQPGLKFMEDGVSKAMQQSTTLQRLLIPKGHKRSVQKHACYIRKNPRDLTSGILCPLHHTQVTLARPLGRTPPGACGHVGTSMQMNEIYDKMSVSR